MMRSNRHSPEMRQRWQASASTRPSGVAAHAIQVDTSRYSMAKRYVNLFFALIAFVAAVALAPLPARADDAAHEREYLIKAAFIYNFARFTEWPDGAFAADGMRVCVLGDDPFGKALDSIAGKTIRGREVQVDQVTGAAAAKGCQVLFVSASEGARLAEVIGAIKELPILTIADMPNFATSGGIINLKTVENVIRFEINVSAADRAGLKFSSNLLKLADLVSSKASRKSGNARVL